MALPSRAPQFPQLIMRVAGEANAGFLDIESELGAGFYVLLAYSVAAGVLQWCLQVRSAGPARATAGPARGQAGHEEA